MRFLPTGEAFDNLFRTFEGMACHLEVEDSYSTPEESEPFQRFLNGEPDDFTWHKSWLDLIGEVTCAGKAVRRVRVVTVPHIDYTRWGLSVAPMNIAAGEDIRWLPRHLTAELHLPPDDFWLFDGTRVAFSLFGADGRWVGAAQTTDEDIVRRSCRLWEQVWALATPHSTYAAH